MQNIKGKKIVISGKKYTITGDARKETGIGFGMVVFTDEKGEEYSESGRYFFDEPPYFNQKSFEMDR